MTPRHRAAAPKSGVTYSGHRVNEAVLRSQRLSLIWPSLIPPIAPPSGQRAPPACAGRPGCPVIIISGNRWSSYIVKRAQWQISPGQFGNISIPRLSTPCAVNAAWGHLSFATIRIRHGASVGKDGSAEPALRRPIGAVHSRQTL